MSTIYLIRHGQASAGTDNYDQLSPLGERQAQLLGKLWRRKKFHLDNVFAGKLRRQQHTAELTLAHAGLSLPTQTIPLLDEYDHTSIDRLFGNGIRSDMPDSLGFEDYTGIMDRWRGAASNALQGSESWAQFEQRGWQSIQRAHELSCENAQLALFTSGGVIATLLRKILQLDFYSTMDVIWGVRNASITTLHFDGTRAKLIDFNTVSHLDAECDPDLVTLI